MEEHILLCDSNLCRLCAEANENGINIYITSENSGNLQHLINKYLPIIVDKDDKFPKNICPGCHIQLESTKLFLDLIVLGQSKLREVYKKQVKLSKNLQLENYLNNYSNSHLYLTNHELRLTAEGIDKPKRKRGRPAKKLIQEEKLDELEEIEHLTKEDESEDEEIGMDGRRKRKIRAPARFEGLVQGKELEDILKKEGVIDDDIEIKTENIEHLKKYEIVIGRTEGEHGEDLDEPIVITQKRMKTKIANFKDVLINKFQCLICSTEFLNRSYFNQHMKTHGNESIKVDIIKSETKGILLGKEDTVRLSDVVTSSVSNDMTVLNEESKELELKNSSGINKCLKCNQNFPSQETFKLHMEEHNNNKKTFPCEICGKVLHHASTLVYHKKTEHETKRFVCNTCNRVFKHKQLLLRHQVVHSEKRPFVCQVCKTSFKTHANLVNHTAVHNAEKRFECTECNQKFAHKSSLNLHQRWHEGKKPYPCRYCLKTFSQQGNLREHMRIHTGEKPFFCEVCAKFFTTSSQLKIHAKRHTGEKPWQCEVCSKCFLHKDTYKFHLRRHFNERPHKCPTCNKGFIEGWALKKHQRIHTGEKPFSCNICLRSFADKSNLQKHQKLQKCGNKNVKQELSTIAKIPSRSLHLTQLIDQQGNPISITTQDGHTVPVVTSGDDDSNIQGLMPDGTLVPIEISSMQDLQEQDFNEEISQTNTLDLLESSTLDDTLETDSMRELSSNFQLLTNDDGEVCYVTYSIEEDGALTQELVLDSPLVQN